MRPGAALESLIMAVNWDYMSWARLVSVSGPGVRQQSGPYAAKRTMLPEVTLEALRFRIGIEVARAMGQPAVRGIGTSSSACGCRKPRPRHAIRRYSLIGPAT
jgi:hypothetical protein